METSARPEHRINLDDGPKAFRFVRELLDEIFSAEDGPAGDVEMAKIVALELATNALRYGGTSKPYMEIFSCRSDLLIRCWDGSMHRPETGSTDLLAESGRGLFLVAALTSTWGCHPSTKGGKYVWAVLKSEGAPAFA